MNIDVPCNVSFCAHIKGNPHSEYNIGSKLTYPDCNEEVHISTGGLKNLELHCTSKTCQAQKHWKSIAKTKPGPLLLSFLLPKPRLNPCMVAKPSDVLAWLGLKAMALAQLCKTQATALLVKTLNCSQRCREPCEEVVNISHELSFVELQSIFSIRNIIDALDAH